MAATKLPAAPILQRYARQAELDRLAIAACAGEPLTVPRFCWYMARLLAEEEQQAEICGYRCSQVDYSVILEVLQ